MNSAAPVIKNLFQEDLYQLPSRVIVVVAQPWESISENERTVLSKMLVAVRLSLASVQIIQKNEFAIADLRPLSPSKVLVFGSKVQQASKQYEMITLDGIPVIVAESLGQLDDLKKKNLWIALKQMFAL
jgi:hypothetical protein